ncbi:MAG: aldo/keto reductase [Firmicutes bacterium]|nr:aldo/keto reductase [Bacillota bacterium]
MKKLGFGLMRMPLLNPDDAASFDYETINQMVDIYIKEGFNYFDTAFVYHAGKSEEMVKKAIVDRHKRDAFKLATKLSIWHIKEKEDPQSLFNKQLNRCGVDFFDYYLLHALDTDLYKKVKEFDLFSFGYELKKQGKIKNFGFSFHDSPQLLEEILSDQKKSNNPMPDFVMLQINYADWLNPNIASKKCYEIAIKYQIPVMAMEPVKGGTLVNLPNEAIKLLKDTNPDVSIASWAIRYAVDLEGIIMTLSGMSDLQQLNDNIKTIDNFKPLTQEERGVIDQVVKIIAKNTAIACTYCAYCIKDCPKNIPITNYFQLYNEIKKSPKSILPGRYYNNLTNNHTRASECNGCKKCEKMCPQKLNIVDTLKEIAVIFETVPTN